MRVVLAQPLLDGLTRPKSAKKAAKPRKPKPTVAVDVQPRYTTGVDEHGRRVWTLRFPAPDRMLSGNNRLHYHAEAAMKSAHRGGTFRHAQAAKLPIGLTKVRLDYELHFPTNRHDADALNYWPLLVKPSADAFGAPFEQRITRGKRAGQVNRQPGYLLVPNDTPEFVDGPYIHFGPTCADRRRTPYGEITITITDLSNDPAADTDRPTL